ncbi:MAG TPA: hypothetical protein DIT13_05050 [Verrucomicrobiales bacterium]|nr:hypothetical protein [Verrucomicrobiales bacterium]
MRCAVHALLMLTATLAVAWAQTFGIHHGWLCDCGGVERITLVDHCHGPHSHDCHEDEDHDVPHHHEDGEDEDTHRHTAVVDDLVAKHHEAYSAQAPVLLALASVAWEPGLFRLNPACRRREEPPDKGRRDGPREWPQILTRTIVLRV